MERTPNSTYFNPLLLIFIALIIGACSNRPVAITQDYPASLPPEWTDTPAVSETGYLTPTVPLEFASPTWTPTHTPTPTPAPGSILPSRTPPATPPGNLLPPSDNSSWAIQIPRLGGYAVADRLIPLSDSNVLLVRPVNSETYAKQLELITISPSGEPLAGWLLVGKNESDVNLLSMLPAQNGGALLSLRIEHEDESYSEHTPLLLRLGSDGAVLWERYFRGTPVQALADGGFLLNYYNRLIRVDLAGNVVWEKMPFLESNAFDYELAFAQAYPGGDFMFVGEQIDWVPPIPNAARAGTDELGTTGLWFARLSETDQVLWKQVRNMNLRFSRLAFGKRSDGSVVVAGPMGHYQGCSGHNARGSSWMLSITPDGDVAFSKEYLELRLFGFFPTSDGGVLLFGEGPEVNETELICDTPMLVRLDSEGRVLWSRAYRRGGGIVSAVEMDDESIMLVWVFNPDADFQGMIVRLDAEGKLPDCDVFWSNEQHMPAAAYSPGRDIGAVVSMDINYPTTFYEERAEVERNAWSLIPQPLETIPWCRSVR